MPTGSFTTPGASDPIGEGIQYRLNASALSAGECDYYFGFSTLHASAHPLMILTTGSGGAWTGQIDIQYSDDGGQNWQNIPGESYTANDARRLK